MKVFLKSLMIVGLLIYVTGSLFAGDKDELIYQERDNRSEGIIPKPISGYDIDLISVQANYEGRREQVNTDTVPDFYKMKFFLDEKEKVFVTLRELEYNTYYRADSFSPVKPWKTGFGNEVVLPTADVIKPLGIKMNTLGVLVRLKINKPSADEYVAPAVFYHADTPAKITGYIFHMSIAEDAKIKWKVFKKAGNEEVAQGGKAPEGGVTFAVLWNALDAPSGAYRLVINGYLLEDYQRISKVINFYHKVEVK